MSCIASPRLISRTTARRCARSPRRHGRQASRSGSIRGASAGIFSGETFTRFPLDQPETWQVLSDGRRVGAACPNHPETRKFLRGWIDACAAAGGEVLFWDEPHFYAGLWRGDLSGAWACRCVVCSEPVPRSFSSSRCRRISPPKCAPSASRRCWICLRSYAATAASRGCGMPCVCCRLTYPHTGFRSPKSACVPRRSDASSTRKKAPWRR